ncbi:hypothetical protein HRG_001216 [Hirsutella rhossiliensis]|uniref:Uncharacterized protein n=1 Tax=Hirsutella rhossiliensis TaxID=111463 RepID=A0A9P8N8A6_9HYPO|nr:uncharacterized protein HRG_01216 [Hirsutella rhossiliensis]KAH0968574.1 hypothetical protein HRG_01216 [Hirsutella rhossiliensis]
MIDVNSILGPGHKHFEEFEFAAVDGVKWGQVHSHRKVPAEFFPDNRALDEKAVQSWLQKWDTEANENLDYYKSKLKEFRAGGAPPEFNTEDEAKAKKAYEKFKRSEEVKKFKDLKLSSGRNSVILEEDEELLGHSDAEEPASKCKRDGPCSQKEIAKPEPHKSAAEPPKIANKELEKAIEEASQHEFEKSATQHRVKSVVESKFNQPLEKFRKDVLKYRPLSIKSPHLGGLIGAGLGAGLYVKDIVETFQDHNAHGIDRLAALTSIAPVMGCITKLGKDLSHAKINGLDVLDDALCGLGDVLLFTPAAPLGLAAHVARIFISLTREIVNVFSGPDEQLLKTLKDSRDKYWLEFLEDSILLPTFNSKEFADTVGRVLAMETLAVLSDGAQMLGLIEATRDMPKNGATAVQSSSQELVQATMEDARKNVTVQIVETHRQTLLKLVEKVGNQQKEVVPLQKTADKYNKMFIQKYRERARKPPPRGDESLMAWKIGKDLKFRYNKAIANHLRTEALALPDSFAIAYLIGISLGQDATLPTLSPPENESASISSDNTANWEMHPLTLNATDYLLKKQSGISKEDADTIAIQQTVSVAKS